MKAAIVSELKHQALMMRKKAVRSSAEAKANRGTNERRWLLLVGEAIAYRDAARSLIGRAKRVRKTRR